jgi:hypothetical protein
MAKESKIVEIGVSSSGQVVVSRDVVYGDIHISGYDKGYPTYGDKPVSPASMRRIILALAKLAGVAPEQPNVFSAFAFWDNPEDAIYDRIAQADEAERKARTK